MAARYVVAKSRLLISNWQIARRLGLACYPENRNEDASYPGEAGAEIVLGDDGLMVEQFLKKSESLPMSFVRV